MRPGRLRDRLDPTLPKFGSLRTQEQPPPLIQRRTQITYAPRTPSPAQCRPWHNNRVLNVTNLSNCDASPNGPKSGGLDELDQDPARVLGVDEVDPTVRGTAARGVK
jgi:hypothetical protein